MAGEKRWVNHSPSYFNGECCTQTAIRSALPAGVEWRELYDSAIATIVAAASLGGSGDRCENLDAIVGWNDSQTSVEPVLAAFDLAIAKQEASE